MKSVLFAMQLLLAAPAMAQTADSSSATPNAEGTAAAAPSSAAAVEIAAKLFPDGSYRKMLGPAMTNMISRMSDQMTAMPIGPLLKSFDLPDDQASKFDKATIDEIVAISDPYFKERMRLGMDALFARMIPIFENLEPDLREGLAKSLDNRFSQSELADIRTFYATPSGNTYASQQMLLFVDPAVMGKMQAGMPKIMEAMPDMIKAMAEATKDLPPAKAYKDLTPAERERLLKLLGINSGKTKK